MMFLLTLASLLNSSNGASTASRSGILEQKYFMPTCEQTPFCNRNLRINSEVMELGLLNDFYYTLDPTSIAVGEGSISGTLNLAC